MHAGIVLQAFKSVGINVGMYEVYQIQATSFIIGRKLWPNCIECNRSYRYIGRDAQYLKFH